MATAITESRKMFEILSKKPQCNLGLRLAGGPTGIGRWPISYVAEVSGVVSLPSGAVLQWLHNSGMLATLTTSEVLYHEEYIWTRRLAGDTDLHVVLFSVVHDVTQKNIDLHDGTHLYANPLPHPRSSSALAYLTPALYWHDIVESWLQ
jgi:hypothetical protein